MVCQYEPVVHFSIDSLRTAIPGSFLEGSVEYVKTEFIGNHIAFNRQQDETCQVHRAILTAKSVI